MNDGMQQADPLAQDDMPHAGVPEFLVNLAAPDLSAFLAGNTGIEGFTSFSAVLPGPHIALISLIHGNEIGGAIVLAEYLQHGLKPLRGRLTIGFANLAAFANFDPSQPLASRFVDEDLNRVWDDSQLFGVRRSTELDRAREIRPLIDTADILLDLHSMLWPSEPLLLCGPSPRGKQTALALATPQMVIADTGHAGGKRLIDYGHFTAQQGSASAMLVEAGQHWQPQTLLQTRATIETLLLNHGMIDGAWPSRPNPVFAHVTETITARTNRFKFTSAFRGGDIIAKANTLIAYDGDAEIRTPYDDCLLVMPSLRTCRDHTAVRLAKFA